MLCRELIIQNARVRQNVKSNIIKVEYEERGLLQLQVVGRFSGQENDWRREKAWRF